VHAAAAYDSVLGTAACAWRREGATLEIDVVVPPGAEGVIVLPDTGEDIAVGPGRHTVTTTFREPADDPDAPFLGWRREAVDAS
jgi:alpha-L-rhamnosidase